MVTTTPTADPPYARPMRVVLVDDERRLVELIAGYLRAQGATVTSCFDGPTGLAAARDDDVDVVVLDLMLPGLDGLDLCRRLRIEGNDVPILMLTARGAVGERVSGLEAGTDDYLVKPFALEELHARLRAIRRRRDLDDSQQLTAGDLTLDSRQQRAWLAGNELVLKPREFKLLSVLMLNKGHVVTRAALEEQVWSHDVAIASNSMEVHVSRLRGQLAGSAHVQIRTIRGVGYRLDSTRR
jgi:DNA-binding response OmpR family regulator